MEGKGKGEEKEIRRAEGEERIRGGGGSEEERMRRRKGKEGMTDEKRFRGGDV